MWKAIRRLRRRQVVRAGLGLALAASLAACNLPGAAAPTATSQTATVQRGTVEATINASGTVRARADLSLSPTSAGTISEVLIQVGDRVRAGQPLLTTDTREQRLTLRQAEANLASAQAQYNQVKAGATEKEIVQAQAAVDAALAKAEQTARGATTAPDIASAQAALRSAEAKLAATKAGIVTEADIVNAEAALRSAEAKLAQARAGAAPADVAAARLTLQQARENRAKQESQLSLNKENARLAMEQAASALRAAQAKYGAAKLVYDEAVRTGKDPNIAPSTTGQDSNRKLTDVKLRQYKADYEAAEQTMKQAEQTLEQKRLAYEDSRTQEIVGLQTADSQIAAAQVSLDKLLAPPDPEEVAQAQATVDQARAALDKLRQPALATDVAQAQAAVDQARAALAKLQQPADADEVAQARASATSAQAALDELKAGPTATALETALASVKQAEAARDAQQLKLDQMTLTAPFAGVVAAVQAVPGQPASSSSITLVDDSTLMIDVSVAENDIAEISLGQPVRATFSALPNQTITGTVTTIAPKATVQSNVVSYLMTVALDGDTAGVKTGMTASVTVVTGQAANVLTVPNRAIQTQGQQKVVTVQRQGQTVSQPVQVGLVGDSRAEIVSGLAEGDTVVIAGAATTSTTTRSPQISTGLGIPGTGAAPKP